MPEEILRTEELWKREGDVTAVAGMNLRVYERAVFRLAIRTRIDAPLIQPTG
jgi:hypothetical protein